MDDVRGLWMQTSGTALTTVADDRVAANWGEPSSLPGMTVGQLAGHLLRSGILTLEESLDHEVPVGQPITVAKMYSLIPLDAEADVHEEIRSDADRQSAEGRDELLDRCRASRSRLISRLGAEPADRQVGLAWGGFPLPFLLDDFVRSRIMEMVVHSDDLASSVEGLELDMSRAAVATACHMGIEITIRRHGAVNVLQSLFRRDRHSLDALRPI